MLSALRSNFRNVSNVLQEGVDADGGYLVPEEYDSRLIDGLEEENIIRKPWFYDEQHHILTAIGFAFREFAIESAKLLGFEISDDKFSGPRKDRLYTEEELTFRRSK